MDLRNPTYVPRGPILPTVLKYGYLIIKKSFLGAFVGQQFFKEPSVTIAT